MSRTSVVVVVVVVVVVRVVVVVDPLLLLSASNTFDIITCILSFPWSLGFGLIPHKKGFVEFETECEEDDDKDGG